MKQILVTQRVFVDPVSGERRDALDQRWPALLWACGLMGLSVPNDARVAERVLAEHAFDGVLLTGGNDLARHGGDAPERDQVERLVLEHAVGARLPTLGVCRGMQLIMEHFGVQQTRVAGHVQPRQEIEIDGLRTEVNSYHDWGCRETSSALEVWARADDGVIKGIRHRGLPLVGVMWHPERMDPFRAADLVLFRDLFAGPVESQA